MQRFADLFKRFRKDERGVFAVFFACIAVVLIAASGAVVDFTRVQQARTRAQIALDSAALALQSKIDTMTATQLKDQAQALLTERMADNSVTAVVEAATPDTTAGKLTISGYISVPTYFVQLVGIRDIRSSMLSEVTQSSSDIEISLSLDVTGSMAAVDCDWWDWDCEESDKIGDLIDATNTLIDLIVSDTQTPTYSKMAIVPWSSSANMGSTYAANVRGTPNTTTKNITAASWLVASTTKSISGITRGGVTTITSNSHGYQTGDTVYISGVSGITTGGWNPNTCINGGSYVVTRINSSSYSIPLNTSSCTSYSSGGNATKCQVAKCEMVVTSNAHGYANGDSVHIASASWLRWTGYFVANATTNTFSLVGSFGPSEGSYASGAKIWCGNFGCSYRVFTSQAGSIQDYPVSNCVTDRTTNTYNDTAPSTTKLGFHYSSNGSCITNTIQPLTSSKPTLHALANSLVAAGSTSGHIGLAWGWYMISPNFGYLWPASAPRAYGGANLVKAVVFMTDGIFNTPYCSGVVANDALSGAGGDSSHINCASPHGSSRSQAETLCDAIKAPSLNIKLYVVGFDLADDEDTLDFLEDCASGPEYFFQADDGDALEAAFAAIADSLSDLRISR